MTGKTGCLITCFEIICQQTIKHSLTLQKRQHVGWTASVVKNKFLSLQNEKIVQKLVAWRNSRAQKILIPWRKWIRKNGENFLNSFAEPIHSNKKEYSGYVVRVIKKPALEEQQHAGLKLPKLSCFWCDLDAAWYILKLRIHLFTIAPQKTPTDKISS